MGSGSRVFCSYAVITVLVLGSCQTPGRPPASPCDGKLEVEPSIQAESIQLIATNSCHVPLFIRLSFTKLENLDPSRELPVETVIPANSEALLLRLEVRDPYKRSNYAPTTLVRIGGPSAIHDDSIEYLYPFGGSAPRKLAQGVDGGITHTGNHRYAFDFGMPIGTPVLAARSGVVFKVKDGFPEGGFSKKYFSSWNQVVILHEDNTFSTYGHLRAGIIVEEGQLVSARDLLGYSGNSGYSKGPHLHFHVSIRKDDGPSRTIPISFQGGVVPVKGELYGPTRQDGRVTD